MSSGKSRKWYQWRRECQEFAASTVQTISFVIVQRQFRRKFNKRQDPARSVSGPVIQIYELIGAICYNKNGVQRYLEQLQNVIMVIQRARHVDTSFQQDGARLHAANVDLDVLYDVFGTRVLSNRFSEHFGCWCSWPPCSPDLNRTIISFGAISKIVCTAPTRTLFKLEAEIDAVAEEVTGDMLRSTHDNFEVHRSKYLVLNVFTCRPRAHKTLHESELSFMYHMLLYPRKLGIYRTSELAFFLNTVCHPSSLGKDCDSIRWAVVAYSPRVVIG
jgi:hypothetical protein